MNSNPGGAVLTTLSYVISAFTTSLLFFPETRAQGRCGVSGSSLRFSPAVLPLNRDNPMAEVRVSCGYPNIPNVSPLGLKLQRVGNYAINSIKLIYANASGFQSNARKKLGQDASGSYNTSLVLQLKKASCGDADYLYECFSTTRAFSDRNRVECLKQGVLNVASNPTDIRLKATPKKDYYNVGDDLKLTCSATVRVKGERGKEAYWVWEMKKPGGGWTAEKTRISIGHMETSSDGCLKVRYTDLKTSLRGSDDGIVFRCYVIKDDKSYLPKAATFKLQVDSFLFGLSTASGTVVLLGIFIILAAVILASCTLVRHFMKRSIDNQRAMYTERVMNRLDKLLRYEHELIGGQLRKKKEEMAAPPPPPPPPPKPKAEKDTSVDPHEVFIQVVVEEKGSDTSIESSTDVSEASEAETEPELETESEPEPEKPKPRDLFGPWEK